MGKKTILIISHALELGGAERALLGLLNSIDHEKYKVDLFLMRHQGELMSLIPKQVNLLPEIPQYASLAVPYLSVIKKKQYRVAYGRLYGRFQAKKFKKRTLSRVDNGVAIEYSHKYSLKYMPQINENFYDLVISFLTPHYFAAERAKGRKKIAWIHTDYASISIDVASELVMWSKFDHIISISDECSESFRRVFPSLGDRILRIENILSSEVIHQQAEQFDATDEMPNDGQIRLLSIGRFSEAKNFDNIPDLCRRLLNSGLDVIWYLIGYGGDEPLIRKKIVEVGMEKKVIILGKKDNPYPYIKACDVYIQPSRYEGKCVAVREAQILGKPIIITNYNTASSQLTDGYNGVVVPMDNEGCASGIAALLRDPLKQEILRHNCETANFSNSEEIKKLYFIIEN